MSLALILSELKSTVKGGVLLAGSFRFKGSSDPDTVIGDVASVTQDSTGVWTVTFKSELKSRGVVAVAAFLEADASMLTVLQGGAFDADDGTMIVRAFTEAAGTLAAADIAAGSNRGNWCHIVGLAKFSTAPDGSGIS